jgi:hypothetical protein
MDINEISVTITLKKEEIANDIANIAYVTGRRLSTPETAEKAADVQSPFQEADSFIVIRALGTAISQVKKRCGRYLSSGLLSDTNALRSLTGNYVLSLKMPYNFNIGITSALTEAINNYLVNYCVYTIFEKTNPNEAESYLSKATLNSDEIKSCLEQRVGPVRSTINILP